MASDYKPQGTFNVWFQVLNRELKFINGVNVADYVPGIKAKCSCINYSTNNITVNDLKSVQDQWNVETYYTPKIKKGDRIKLLDDDSIYDIVGIPENVRRENRYLKFKMVRVNG